VTGGFNPVTASVELYNPKTNQWAALPDLKTARWGHTLENMEGHLYVIGGMTNTNEVMSSVEKYNATCKSWTVVASLQSARRALASAAFQVSKVLDTSQLF
jgi:kelch-like protein 18